MSPVTHAPAVFDGNVTVVRVVARSDVSDWATIDVADEHGEVVRMVGTTIRKLAEPGRRLHVIGRWKDHPRYGRQVTVARAEAAFAADSSDDPKRFLEGVPYVGAKRAQLLIDRYGAADVLRRIDDNPSAAFRRLGLPGRHAAEAVTWWRDRR